MNASALSSAAQLLTILELGLARLRTIPETRPRSDHTRTLKGRLTWESEGLSNATSPYYSRRAHVPSPNSGVTIGRGYDLKLRSRSEILKELTKAGIPVSHAERLAEGHGKAGHAAREFIATRSLPEITVEQERALFDKTWNDMYLDVIRISQGKGVQDRFGTVPWKGLDPKILDVLVDLRFRGDYTHSARERLQATVVANDIQSFSAVICHQPYWRQVPPNRFKARCTYLM